MEPCSIWKQGDTLQIHLDMGLRLEPLNETHSELAALLYGPLVLFPVNSHSKSFNNSQNKEYTREQLLGAKQNSDSAWVVFTKGEKTEFKPFIFINDETYRLYNKLIATRPPR